MDDYIRKQSVIDYLNGYLIPINECGDDSLFDRGQRRALTNAIQDILAIKAADVQPVKHGRWLPHKITASSKCSECNRVFADETPCCPNCGAKMDGDSDGIE